MKSPMMLASSRLGSPKPNGVSQTEAGVRGVQSQFDSIEELLHELRAGRPVVLVDDEDRENEGDLVVAAEKITPESVNFMVRHGCGILGLALSKSICDRLGLETVPGRNVADGATPWTPHIDARKGITTGTSAYDRARTIHVAIDEKTTPADIVVGKGHVPCLRARNGGVLVRAGHTEGSVDLARLAGLREGAVICEIMTPDGRMARRGDLHEFCQHHGLKISSIAELIKYRRSHESPLTRELEIKLPTRYGVFDLIAYRGIDSPEPHLALCMGGVGLATKSGRRFELEPTLVRVHSQCLTGDALGSTACDCGSQLDAAMSYIAEHGRGVVLYARQEGRGIGLLAKLRAYGLQQKDGLDTVDANTRLGLGVDERDYSVSAWILLDLGARSVRLLTNNPRKVAGLEQHGVKVVERVPIQVAATEHNRSYLHTKKEKLGHWLDTSLSPPGAAPQAAARSGASGSAPAAGSTNIQSINHASTSCRCNHMSVAGTTPFSGVRPRRQESNR